MHTCTWTQITTISILGGGGLHAHMYMKSQTCMFSCIQSKYVVLTFSKNCHGCIILGHGCIILGHGWIVHIRTQMDRAH